MDEQAIKKMQKVLLKIDLKQPVFFNVLAYKNMGLVASKNQYYISHEGKKEVLKTNYFLTVERKRILNITI